MSCLVNNNIITVTKGDTINLELKIMAPDGFLYQPCEDDTIRFVMKKYYNDADPLIEKVIPFDDLTLRIEASETKVLEADINYFYDVELTLSDGTVDTIIPSGILKIKKEVD